MGKGALPDTQSLAPPGNTVTRAMIIMVSAMVFVPMMDVVAKMLSSSGATSPATITWFRFVGQALLLAVLIPLTLGRHHLVSRFTLVNLIRGILVGTASLLFFVAIKYLPLADAIAIFFVEPMLLMLLSVLFLRETAGWRRGLAAFVGFCGALLVIQPSYAIFGPTALLPLATALLFAVYLILSRKIGAQEHPLTMQFWSGIGGAVACTIILLLGNLLGAEDFSLSLPEQASVYLWLLLIAVIATSSHVLIIIAFSMAPASILAPFQYIEIITMTIAGYLVFGDFPSPMKWLGIAIIVGSGLYIFLRERKLEAVAVRGKTPAETRIR